MIDTVKAVNRSGAGAAGERTLRLALTGLTPSRAGSLPQGCESCHASCGSELAREGAPQIQMINPQWIARHGQDSRDVVSSSVIAHNHKNGNRSIFHEFIERRAKRRATGNPRHRTGAGGRVQRSSAATVLGLVRRQHFHPRPAAGRDARGVSRPGDLAGDHRRDPRCRRFLRGGRDHLHCRSSWPRTEPDPVARDLRRARQYRPDPGLADVAPGLGNRQHHHRRVRVAVAVLDPVRFAGGSEKRAGADPDLHRDFRAADLVGLRPRSRHACW